jgi:hypothetical protein
LFVGELIFVVEGATIVGEPPDDAELARVAPCPIAAALPFCIFALASTTLPCSKVALKLPSFEPDALAILLFFSFLSVRLKKFNITFF